MGYTITFFDRAERKYQLLIDGGGTALDGGAVTFETQENADADMFTPVRCQTGTFRYIGRDDHATWLNIIPSSSLSKRVVLQRYVGSAWITQWQGYIQPQVFENEYPGRGTVEHEFAVQCPLSVLDTIGIDPSPDSGTIINSHPTMTFGMLLNDYIFGNLFGTTITGYYVQGSKTVTEARLALKVMWANFLTTDSSNNVVCKYTCKQVLEEFCKFFGYTCRMHGTYVYFTQPTEGTNTFTYFTSLKGTGNNYSQGSFSITDAMLADTNHHEELHPGIGKATVRSDINALDNLVEIPYDELYDQYNIGLPSSSMIVRSVDWYERNVYNLIRRPNANSSTLEYDNDTVSLRCFMPTVPGTGQDAGNGKKYCRFFVYDDGDVGNPEDQKIPQSKEQFGWKKCIEIFHSYNYSGSNTADLFSITSKQVFVISDGFLYINFKCDEVSAWVTDSENKYYPNHSNPTAVKSYCYARARLRIGDKYWNGSAWVGSSNTFELPFDSSGVRSNRSSYGGVLAPQYNGYGVPVGDTMRGEMEFAILDVPTYQVANLADPGWADINGFLPIMDFEIGFVRGTIEDTKHRGNEYTWPGGTFREEVNVDLIWAADVVYGPNDFQRHMPAGLGYILDATDKPTASILSMSGYTVTPEEELSQVIANYGSTTHRLVQMNLRSSMLGDINPTALSSGLETGMFPLAISHDWRNDVTTLTLISI